MEYDIIIIGGGAAGLLAGIVTGQRQKYHILIIEKNNGLGKKILVTGNGRCNLTNINLSPDKYCGENTKCLYSIFNRFSCDDTIRLFEELGVKLKVEQDGRVFPVTDKALTVLNALTKEVARLDIKLRFNERVIIVSSYQNSWQVKTDKNVYQTKAVILTTGGKSYPQLGSTGDGYEIAHKLGHRIVEPKPALVPLELKGDCFKTLQGISLNVLLKLSEPRKIIVQQAGELLFTHFGVSGPLILDLSHIIINSMLKPNFIVSINFLPEHDNINTFITFLKTHAKKKLINVLSNAIPKQVVSVLLNKLLIKTTKQISQITRDETQLIFEKLTNWQLDIKGPRSFKESMVTAGGVAMNEVNPRTMESLIRKRLYFAGEILDINGISGGYNLQFAWSTGYIAGNSV